MVFSSLIFLYAFLPLSLAVYVLCRSLRAKNISLLVFSLIFYVGRAGVCAAADGDGAF